MPLIRKGPQNAPSVTVTDLPEALNFLLQCGTADERWAAVRKATVADVDIMGRALALEQDAQVREAIFTCLARFGNVRSVETVLPYLRSDDASLRTGALDALRAMPGAVRPQLRSLLSDADSDVRLLACEIVRELSDPGAAQLLCDLLDVEREANVCGAAVEVLAEIGGPEALPALQRCTDRFRDVSFLTFSIKVASDRLRAQSSQST